MGRETIAPCPRGDSAAGIEDLKDFPTPHNTTLHPTTRHNDHFPSRDNTPHYATEPHPTTRQQFSPNKQMNKLQVNNKRKAQARVDAMQKEIETIKTRANL